MPMLIPRVTKNVVRRGIILKSLKEEVKERIMITSLNQVMKYLQDLVASFFVMKVWIVSTKAW